MLKSGTLTDVHSGRSERNRDRRIVLTDLNEGGHHAAYLRHLIYHWGEQDLPGYLDILVLPSFVKQHPDLIELVRCYRSVRLVVISSQEEAQLGDPHHYLQRKLRHLREWHLQAHYVRQLQATECLFMYFDTYQMAVALRQPFPCPFSGLYFRARFHYQDFPEQRLTWSDSFHHHREQVHLQQVLRHPQFKTLFCLDQFAVNHLRPKRPAAEVVYLPDPVNRYPYETERIEALRTRLNIEPDRRVFLLFGVLDRRKGIYQMFQAIEALGADYCQRICLLLVGHLEPGDRLDVLIQVARLSQTLPIQIILQDEFVPEQDSQLYFQLADVILAPYQRHVGPSGIVVRAAAAQKPVLASDYGLMGEWTRRHRLGLTVNASQPSEIAQQLMQCLDQPPDQLGDRAQMQQFAAQHSVERFSTVVWERLSP